MPPITVILQLNLQTEIKKEKLWGTQKKQNKENRVGTTVKKLIVTIGLLGSGTGKAG